MASRARAAIEHGLSKQIDELSASDAACRDLVCLPAKLTVRVVTQFYELLVALIRADVDRILAEPVTMQCILNGIDDAKKFDLSKTVYKTHRAEWARQESDKIRVLWAYMKRTQSKSTWHRDTALARLRVLFEGRQCRSADIAPPPISDVFSALPPVPTLSDSEMEPLDEAAPATSAESAPVLEDVAAAPPCPSEVPHARQIVPVAATSFPFHYLVKATSCGPASGCVEAIEGSHVFIDSDSEETTLPALEPGAAASPKLATTGPVQSACGSELLPANVREGVASLLKSRDLKSAVDSLAHKQAFSNRRVAKPKPCMKRPAMAPDDGAACMKRPAMAPDDGAACMKRPAMPPRDGAERAIGIVQETSSIQDRIEQIDAAENSDCELLDLRDDKPAEEQGPRAKGYMNTLEQSGQVQLPLFQKMLKDCVHLCADAEGSRPLPSFVRCSQQRGSTIFQVVNIADKKVVVQTTNLQFGDVRFAETAAYAMLALFDAGASKTNLQELKRAGALGVVCGRSV